MSATSEVTLFVIPRYDGGGAERNMVTLASSLQRKGRAVLIIGLLENDKMGGDIPSVGLAATRVLSAAYALNSLIRRERPAAVVSTLKHVSVIVAALHMLHLRRFRHVVRVANTYSEELATAPPIIRRVWKLLLWLTHRSAEETISVSQGVQQDLYRYLHCSYGTVIPNPVNLDLLVNGSPEAPPGERRRNILAVGRLTRQKNYPLLIRSFGLARARVGELDLIVLGEGPERNSLERLVSELGLQDSVQIAGWVRDPNPYYQNADVVAISSDYEGLPNVILEALAFDVPVVSTDCPSGPREILTSTDLGFLVPTGDEAAFADALVLALTTTTKGGLKRRAYVSTQYALDNIVSRYEEALFPK